MVISFVSGSFVGEKLPYDQEHLVTISGKGYELVVTSDGFPCGQIALILQVDRMSSDIAAYEKIRPNVNSHVSILLLATDRYSILRNNQLLFM